MMYATPKDSPLSISQLSDSSRSKTMVPACRVTLGNGEEFRLEDSQDVCKRLLKQSPDYSLAAVRLLIPFAAPEFSDRLIDGLRKAGLPE